MIYLLVGLIIGFWARDIWQKVTDIYDSIKDRIEKPAGVVKPTRKVAEQMQPTDTSAGAVHGPTPEEVLFEEYKNGRRRV